MNDGSFFPCLSILIPTWNRVNEVLEAIQSLELTGKESVEVIVVDNGSPLEIYQRLEETLSVFSYVRLFRNEENIGMVRNWNKCIQYARGEWLSLLCSDDLFLPNRIMMMLDLLQNLEPCLVIQSSQKIVSNVWKSIEENRQERIPLPIASGNFFHKELVEKNGIFDERFEYSPDAEFWYRLSSDWPVLILADSNAKYRSTNTNYMWTTWRKKDFLLQTRLLNKTVEVKFFPFRSSLELELKLDHEEKKLIKQIIQTSLIRFSCFDIFVHYYFFFWKRFRREPFSLVLLHWELFVFCMSKVLKRLKK